MILTLNKLFLLTYCGIWNATVIKGFVLIDGAHGHSEVENTFVPVPNSRYVARFSPLCTHFRKRFVITILTMNALQLVKTSLTTQCRQRNKETKSKNKETNKQSEKQRKTQRKKDTKEARSGIRAVRHKLALLWPGRDCDKSCCPPTLDTRLDAVSFQLSWRFLSQRQRSVVYMRKSSQQQLAKMDTPFGENSNIRPHAGKITQGTGIAMASTTLICNL